MIINIYTLKNNDRGQSLVALLFFMIVATTITSAAAIVILINSRAGAVFQEGNSALLVAESGAENAIIRLLRDWSYSGETLSLTDSTIQISVSGSNPKTVVSTGNVGSFQRQVQVALVENNGILTISNWITVF